MEQNGEVKDLPVYIWKLNRDEGGGERDGLFCTQSSENQLNLVRKL